MNKTQVILKIHNRSFIIKPTPDHENPMIFKKRSCDHLSTNLLKILFIISLPYVDLILIEFLHMTSHVR
jgi:hypothetical protein